MKVYEVKRQRTAGAYITMKTFLSMAEAQAYMELVTSKDPYYNTGNTHHCNRYKITETTIEGGK